MTERRIGVVEHYFPKAHAAVVRLEGGDLHTGDTIHIVGHGVDFEEVVDRLEMDHRAVREAHEGESVGVHVVDRVREKAEVLLVQPEA